MMEGGKKQCRPAEACHDPRPSPDFRMCEFAKCINFAFEVPHPVITSASHHTPPYHLSSTPLNIPSISYPAPVHRSSLFPILPMPHYPICLLCCPSHSPIHLPSHLNFFFDRSFCSLIFTLPVVLPLHLITFLT